jgi:hypothetical protein
LIYQFATRTKAPTSKLALARDLEGRFALIVPAVLDKFKILAEAN